MSVYQPALTRARKPRSHRLTALPQPQPGSQTLSVPADWTTAIGEWEKELRAAGRPATTRGLRTYHLRRFGSEHSGLDPYDTQRQHIVDWMASYAWASQTRRSYRSSLSLFFRWAHEAGHMPQNPARTLPSIPVKPGVPRPAPHAAVDIGLRAVQLRTRLAVLILVATGMRRAECAALHRDSLRFDDYKGWGLHITGKGGRERWIPIPAEIARAIHACPPGYIFPGRIDGHLSAAYLGKLVSRALPDGIAAHNLRHRYATMAYQVERDIRAVQDLLGHARVTTTQIYTYVPDDSLRRAADGALVGLEAA